MKQISIVVATLLVLCSFSGAKQFIIQIYETEGVNIKKYQDYYTYENDTLRMDYVFWADGGVMAFRIINKTDKPLYINWFKSAYVSNIGRSQYWNEQNKQEISREGISRRNKIVYPAVKGYTGSVAADRVKPEKISFIPPNSFIEKNSCYLTEEYFTDWGKDYKLSIVPRHDDPKFETKIFEKEFTPSNSPLTFRNFVTLSFNEHFTSEFYISHDFYVKSITAMERNHFWDDVVDEHVNDTHDWRSFRNNFYSKTQYKKGADFYYQTYRKGYQ
ncbi:MAG: hypothetical protein JWO03_3485 [Bacteroidetes bacterium]|nr:hypothetical protein [Bacteroidota bacterium]